MMKVGGLTSTLEYHQPDICFQGQRPRPGCQGELQFPGEKEVSCVSWEERRLVLGGGLTVGSLVLRVSSQRLSLSVSVA